MLYRTRRVKINHVIIGCIYRHPHSGREYLNREGYEVYIAGDISHDFFLYSTDKFTSDYLDMLLNLGYMPIITKATRITDHSATLINHIYTNAPQQVLTSGICLADISDHLPCFCTIATKLPTFIREKYYRDFSHFDKELFVADLAKIEFYSLANNDDVNCSMNNVFEMLQEITDKHAPIKKATNAKKRQLKKPWISNSILNSIKAKQKMFGSHFLSHDQVKVNFFKKYNNKLNKIKELAKRTYFSNQFYLN